MMRKPTNVVTRAAVLAASALGMIGCLGAPAPEAEDRVAQTSSEVVYGLDDRFDVFEHKDPSMQDIAQRATVALMSPGILDMSDPSNVRTLGPTLGASLNLCQGERFFSDPRASFCSGTLIDDDLVLTAGHCVSREDCAGTRVVFNFARGPNGESPRLTSADVFSCLEVVAHKLTIVNGRNLDYAILRLDRKAAPLFTPAPVRQERTPLPVGQRVGIIGAPSSIPLKVDTGGKVRDPRAATFDFFEATTDSFGGNSGSGVYEMSSYNLAGILVRGEADYRRQGSCNIVNTCTEAGCSGEDVTYVAPALDELCAAESSFTPRLCAPRNKFAFAAGDTTNFVALAPGQTITAGTCGVPTGSAVGAPAVSLRGPRGALLGTEAASASCAGGTSVKFTVPPLQGGLYQLRAGCAANTTCSGDVAYAVAGPTGGSFSFAAARSGSALFGTTNTDIVLTAGQTVTLGTCGVPGAAATGDTAVRLFLGANQVASNNDGPAGCGGASLLTFTARLSGTYQARVGCLGDERCSGTVAYTVGDSGAVPFSAAATGSAPPATVNVDIALAEGHTIAAGTCGVPGAAGSGDSLLRLFFGGEELASNDNAEGCPNGQSKLTFTAKTTGVYQLRAGCAGNARCGGTLAYVLSRNGGGGAFNYSALGNDQQIVLGEGQEITINSGAPTTSGAPAEGDARLQLFGPDSQPVLVGEPGGPLLFTVEPGRGGTYVIRADCPGETCQGAAEFAVTPPQL